MPYEDKQEQKEAVDHPAHYTHGKIEVIETIADMGLAEGFCLGNALKYIARHKHKGKPIEDLKKARWFLDWYIKYMEMKK